MMFPIFQPFLDDDAHLASVNGAYYLSLLQKNCLVEAVVRCDVLFCCVCKMALQPIVQMQFSHFSIRSFDEAESAADGQRKSGLHSQDFNILDFYFWVAAQNQDFQGKTKLNRLTDAICEKFRRRKQPGDNQYS